MNNLIKVNFKGDRQTVSARELWEFLGRPHSEFMKWFSRYSDYGFVENEDYRAYRQISRHANGRDYTQTDYEITIDMAKELAMLQKTKRGKIARQYFIKLEKKWNSPEAIMARALKMADRKISKLEEKIEELKPKEIFADAVTASDTSILVRELATLLKQNGVDTGQNRLFEWLRENGYLIKRKGSDYNMPTQKSMDLGLFEIKETTINHSDGRVSVSKTPKVTGKGQIYFINKFKELELTEAC